MQPRHVHTPAADPPGELPAGQSLASHADTDDTAVAAAAGSDRGPGGTASASGAADIEATCSDVQSTLGSPWSEMSVAPPDGAAGRAGDGFGGDGADAGRAPPVGAEPHPHPEGLSDLKRLQLVLEGCDTDSAVEAALLAVAPLCRPSKRTLAQLICKYSKAGLWRRGLAVFDHLHLLQIDVDLPLANAALWACSRGADGSEACRVFCEMPSRLQAMDHDCADGITYRALFSALHARNMWQHCVAAYTVAFQQGAPLDGQACLYMLRMLRRAGHWQLAEACLLAELAQQLRLEPFTALAAVLARTPAPGPHGSAAAESAGTLLDTVRKLGSAQADGGSDCLPQPAHGHGSDGVPVRTGSPDDRFGRCAGVAWARGLAWHEPATRCCNVLLRAYSEATPPQPGRAVKILHAMSSTSKIPHGGFLKPDTVSYELVALAHFRAGLAAKGLEVLDACALSFQPATAAGYAQCMAAAASAGDADGAAALWRHMAALGVPPDDDCRSAFLAAASQASI